MTLVDKHALTAALAERDAERAEVARLRAAVEEIRAIFALQCPPMAPENYIDSGAWMAHRWWNTVLGGALEVLTATEDQP